ncbi:MAG TPA: substrate-binding domain-containing protein [Pseudobacteroides sp.]|uniref:substrate-binding domain-containing protein n=1 Tax=Pseudobacteroides sp. TaxID=1968840 RepID=UPI002F95558C
MNKKRLNIGVITKYVENFYFGSLIKGIHKTLKIENARLFVVNTYMLDKFRLDVKGDTDFFPISSDHIDGWIILTEGVSETYKIKLIQMGKPVVLVAHKPNQYNCTTLIDDGFNSAKQVVEHFLSHGHKRIAYVGCNGVYDMTVRYSGYRKTLEEYGLFDQSLVYDVDDPMPAIGKEVAVKMLERGVDFTAVFAANDYLAFGIIDGLKECNVHVPEDVAVIGYDNNDKSSLFKPSLTSVDQNTYNMGIEAGKAILKNINKKGLEIETILIKSDFIIRESCGCNIIQKKDDIPTKENIEYKRSMIERLQDVMYKNSDFGAKLFSLNIDQIIKLIPEIVDEYTWFCYGLLKDNDSKYGMVIQTIVDKIKNERKDENIECNLESFPPIGLMLDYELHEDDVIWIVPISTEKKDIGAMAYVSKIYVESSLYVYDMHMVLYNLLGVSIDRDLALTDLKEALNNLQRTQEQLIESEKLVSLGSLVAGVAHEINNPIGVGVTATTFMESNTVQLKQLFETNKLTKTDLTKFLEKNSECVKILIMNLQKASNLIKSFKQIAVDNTIDEKRSFNVREYVNDVILSLNSKLKKKNIKVNLECSEGLELICNPGQLSQIITNLVLNSVMHAYDEEESGEITIKFEKNEGNLLIEYKDDGKGMEAEVFEKIFEPFFTTKKGSDGSGLGLNIISNIIKQKFGGSIECESKYKQGTKFVIKLPLASVTG